MISQMDMRPMGDTLILIGTVLEERQEARAYWEAKCKQCSRLSYARTITLQSILNCLDLFPTSI